MLVFNISKLFDSEITSSQVEAILRPCLKTFGLLGRGRRSDIHLRVYGVALQWSINELVPDFSWEGVDMTAGDQDESAISKRTVWSQSTSLSKLYSFSSAKIQTWKHQSSHNHQGTRYRELSKRQDIFFLKKSLSLFLKCYTSFGIRKCPLFQIDTWIPEWLATKSFIQLIRSCCYVILVAIFACKILLLWSTNLSFCKN